MAGTEKGIKRSKILTHALGGQTGLLRELGLVNGRSNTSAAWCKGLEEQTFELSIPSLDRFIFTNLLSDEAVQGTILALRAEKKGKHEAGILFQKSSIDSSTFSRPRRFELKRETQISSISLSPSQILLGTTLERRSMAFYMDLKQIPEANSNAVASVHCLHNVLRETFGVYYWASSANPLSGATNFAIAGSNGVTVLKENQGRWTPEFGHRYPDNPDVIAVDWLCPNVIMKGCEDGGVRFWDIRSHGDSRESRVLHPSEINHVRRIDENTIVVAGLQSQLCTYDLRFPSILAVPGHVTNPYNRLDSYKNLNIGHLASGFDVYSDLAAAANDDGRVIIWDVKRGLELRQVHMGGGTPTRKYTGECMCVRFIDGKDDGKALKLVTASGQTLKELSW